MAMDTRELRNVFGSFVTGVTVITTIDAEQRPQGVTANSFSSVSLDPPLVLWSQSNASRSFAAFRDSDRFVVNILAEHQKELSQKFAKPGDKFDGVLTTPRIDGVPALEECCAYLDCRKIAMYPGGDHVVYLGQVEGIERNARRPLAFAHGRYMLAYDHELDFSRAECTSAHLAHNEAVRIASAALPEIASRLDTMLGLAVWGNRGATIIRWELSDRLADKEFRTGVVVSPIASATGLLFSSHLPASMTADLVEDALIAEAASTGQDINALRTEVALRMEQVRAQGVATSSRSSVGSVLGISAPVFDAGGLMILALSAVIQDPGHAIANDKLEANLQAAAMQLSRRLGHAATERI